MEPNRKRARTARSTLECSRSYDDEYHHYCHSLPHQRINETGKTSCGTTCSSININHSSIPDFNGGKNDSGIEDEDLYDCYDEELCLSSSLPSCHSYHREQSSPLDSLLASLDFKSLTLYDDEGHGSDETDLEAVTCSPPRDSIHCVTPSFINLSNRTGSLNQGRGSPNPTINRGRGRDRDLGSGLSKSLGSHQCHGGSHLSQVTFACELKSPGPVDLDSFIIINQRETETEISTPCSPSPTSSSPLSLPSVSPHSIFASGSNIKPSCPRPIIAPYLHSTILDHHHHHQKSKIVSIPVSSSKRRHPTLG